MSKTYTRPTEAELPAKLAEAMGATLHKTEHGNILKGKILVYDYDPLNSRDDAHLAVERCAEEGLIHEFYKNLMQELRKVRGMDCEPILVLVATGAQISYAAEKTLTEHAIAQARGEN